MHENFKIRDKRFSLIAYKEHSSLHSGSQAVASLVRRDRIKELH